MLDTLSVVALTLHAEARSEPVEGKVAVASVIRNRLTLGRWGTTYESVCRAPKQFCLSVNERILTADLRWIHSGELAVGDAVLACDEEPTARNNRKWKLARITTSQRDTAECMRVTLVDGTTVICTPEHPWLVSLYDEHGGAAWVRTDQLMSAGRGLRGFGRYPQRGYQVQRVVHPWQTANSRTAGWLAGFFDGEGYVTATPNSGMQLAAGQADGPVQDELRQALTASGFTSSTRPSSSPKARRPASTTCVSGGFPEQVRFLGTIRPVRLLIDFQRKWVPRRCLVVERVRVASVESVGRQEIQRIGTDAKTYVGEGFLMHNSCWNDGPDANHQGLLALVARIEAGETIDDPAYRECHWIAEGCLSGAMQDRTHGATFYHVATMHPRPSWAYDKTPICAICSHVFYRGIS